ncbi:hypothetical protein C6503_25980 [Candidatus Poribacteria bacterium]|nr:MAG: hypothetical protein C6503_25980 [Candidatus Poribacteria bacterium]
MGLMELLAEIGKQVHEECISKSCSGDGCRVYLTDTPSDRIIVNLECEFEQRKIDTKRCDYVLFCGDASRSNLVVVLIELKSGAFKTSTVADQLQSGADFVSEMFGKLPKEANAALNRLEITCVPTLFHGKRIDRFELRELERAKIRFLSQKPTIKRRKCGEPKNLALVLRG